MTSNIFIDTVNLVARAATSGTALPNVRGKLFAELVLNVRFFNGTGTIIPVDVASVLMEIKLQGAPDGSPALLQSSAPVVTGSGATTLYAFAFDYADGDNLRAALSGLTAPADMICAIQYALSGSTEQIDVAMSFENSYVRPEDQASDPVDAERWQWLTAHATDAGGFAHDDTTRLLSVPGIGVNAAAIAAEATTRAAADNANASAITAETTARAAADTANASAITAETTARETGDATNAAAITSEATTRAAADNANAAAITAEAAARAAADTGLQNNINGTANVNHTHPLSNITQSGASVGQVPQWNGANWVPAAAAAGSTLVRGVGSLTGYAVAPNPTQPAALYCTYDGVTDNAVLYLSGSEWTASVTISDSDPSDGSIWVAYGTDLDTMGAAIVGALTALNLTSTISWYYLGAGQYVGNDAAVGSSVQLNGVSAGGWSMSGGGSGGDGTGSGEVTTVTLIPGVAGKQIKLVAAGGYTLSSPSYDPSAVEVGIGLWDGTSFVPCTPSAPFSGSGADSFGPGPYYARWIAYAGLAGLDLVAQIGAGTIPTGGEHALWAIAEQS